MRDSEYKHRYEQEGAAEKRVDGVARLWSRSGAMDQIGQKAVYPGSFDVLTYGHLDVLRRAARMFSHVTIAVAVNRAKHNPMFSVSERLEMLRTAVEDIPNVDTQSFEVLTVTFARQIGATVIIRGLRAVSDFEFELQMAMMNDNIAPEVTTIFLAPAPQYIFLSSTAVKEIALHGGSISEFVPPHVEQMVHQRLMTRTCR